MKTNFFAFCAICLFFFSFAAIEPAQAQIPMGHKVCFAAVDAGDTIPLFYLKEVSIVESSALLSDYEIKHNRKLIRNVKKMLPYAKMSKIRLDQLESQLASMSKSQQRKTIKAAEKQITDEYSAELKRCTISQGKVLLKLIDRETGRTSYTLVDELRGSVRATFYQVFAKLFGFNLKKKYDPANNKEDYLMERVVLAVERGQI